MALFLNQSTTKLKLVTLNWLPGPKCDMTAGRQLVSQESVDLIPARFVLKGLGPENEDLNVKLFVEGKKSPHIDKSEQLTTTPKVTESTPLSQRPAPSTLLAPSPAKTTSSILQLDQQSATNLHNKKYAFACSTLVSCSPLSITKR